MAGDAKPLLQVRQAVRVADLEADVVQAGLARKQVQDMVPRRPTEPEPTAVEFGMHGKAEDPGVELGGTCHFWYPEPEMGRRGAT